VVNCDNVKLNIKYSDITINAEINAEEFLIPSVLSENIPITVANVKYCISSIEMNITEITRMYEYIVLLDDSAEYISSIAYANVCLNPIISL
jgi:hypothetical protein